MPIVPTTGDLVGYDSMRGPVRARIVGCKPREGAMVLRATGNGPASAYPDDTIFTAPAYRVAPWRQFNRRKGTWVPVEWALDHDAMVEEFLRTP